MLTSFETTQKNNLMLHPIKRHAQPARQEKQPATETTVSRSLRNQARPYHPQ
jgi:hypothetical protein